MIDVVVTDGQERSALAVVRSLGRAGYRLHVCAPRTPSLAGSSRYASEEVRITDPLVDPEAFAHELAWYVRSRGARVLLPMSDAALHAVLPRRERFGDVCIPFPDFETYRNASDKFTLLLRARELGIAVPTQWAAEGPGAAELDDLSFLPYPVVVKPSRSVAESGGTRVKLGVVHAEDASQVRAALRAVPRSGYPVLLQERIEGPGCGVFLLFWDGEVKAVFAHRRLREKPPSGGVSTYRMSVEPDMELVEQSKRLLADLGWQGVAMVEFKRCARTGTPYLMEVNGRFWGSLQLAIDSGVDFPAILTRAALGEPLGAPPVLRPDVRLRWILGDVDHLLARLRDPRQGNGAMGGPGSSGRFGALRQVAGSWRPGERWETLRWSDPRPFFKETLEWVRAL